MKTSRVVSLVVAALLAVTTTLPAPEPPSDADNLKKVTGPLSAVEAKLQGIWKPGYTLVFEGRDFCADTQPGEWYEGYIVIRTDEEPAQFDFVIEECPGCSFKGHTSTGIFYVDGETIVVLSPTPGEARPQDFESKDQLVKMRFKGDGRSQVPGEHCSTWSATAILPAR